MFIMFITTLNWDFSVVQWSRHCSFNGGGVGAIPTCCAVRPKKHTKNPKLIYSQTKTGHVATVL